NATRARRILPSRRERRNGYVSPMRIRPASTRTRPASRETKTEHRHPGGWLSGILPRCDRAAGSRPASRLEAGAPSTARSAGQRSFSARPDRRAGFDGRRTAVAEGCGVEADGEAPFGEKVDDHPVLTGARGIAVRL